MRELVIGDVHFGVKSNSVEWLTKQCKLFDTQITDIGTHSCPCLLPFFVI